MKRIIGRTLLSFVCLTLMSVNGLFAANRSAGPDFIVNAYGRDAVSLDGKWNAIIDIFDRGEHSKFQIPDRPLGDDIFYEYSFDGGLQLHVPGDWNSQAPQFLYYEGTVWYQRTFNAGGRKDGERQFLYFAGVSNRCKVFLNGSLIAAHEGAFTPFQAEVTGLLKDEDNFLVVEVNNTRRTDAIPAMDFDWWNYGGITRDVFLITTPQTFINDYFIRLGKDGKILADVSLDAPLQENLEICIPELKLRAKGRTDSYGRVSFEIKAPRDLELWSPENPRLYGVVLSCKDDEVRDTIGFRTLAVRGTEILLNGKPRFMKSISFHEEIPQRMGRACSAEDARQLVDAAVELGCNMVRLAHYPQNEHIVRYAEKSGIILWEEIPLWQGIDFDNKETKAKAEKMYMEMLRRDRNRCAVCFWGLANETRPSESRNAFLTDILSTAKTMDSSRLFAIADDIANLNPASGRIEIDDPITALLDVVAINKYLGWYAKWPCAPEDLKWNVAPGKPLIISEFGCEALYGRFGNGDKAWSWSEDYQERLYLDNLRTFRNIDNLAGISPWVLYDFRSPRRYHPSNQEGWNRKGLLSDKGEKKKAWYVIQKFYREK